MRVEAFIVAKVSSRQKLWLVVLKKEEYKPVKSGNSLLIKLQLSFYVKYNTKFLIFREIKYFEG